VEEGTPQVVALTLPDLDALSSVRLYLPKDLRPVDARRLALKVPTLPPDSVFLQSCYVGWNIML
jgi:hypothetical protein